ncbi:MAG TPA: T9SS type A sorting domain-containing protein, partial [Flavobacteriales bacterium]
QRNRSNAGDDLPLCWPNPNDGGLLQVQVPGEAPTIGPAQLTLHDLSGRLHLDHQLTFDPDGAPRRVDLGHTLPAGIYLVQLHTTSSTYTERLLIAPR